MGHRLRWRHTMILLGSAMILTAFLGTCASARKEPPKQFRWQAFSPAVARRVNSLAVLAGPSDPCYEELRPKEKYRPSAMTYRIQESSLGISPSVLAFMLAYELGAGTRWVVKSYSEAESALGKVNIDLVPSDETWNNSLDSSVCATLRAKLGVDAVCVVWFPLSSWDTGDFLLLKLYSIIDGCAFGTYKSCRFPIEKEVEASTYFPGFRSSRYTPDSNAVSMAREAVSALAAKMR